MRIRETLLAAGAIGALACQRSDKANADSAVPETAQAHAVDSSTTAAVGDSQSGSTSGQTKPPGTIAPPPPRGNPPIADPLSMPRPDTARGIVRIVGSEPMTALILARTDVPNEILSLIGTAQSLLRNLSGVEVAIIGRQTSDRDVIASPRGAFKFMVDSFVVRASDGVAAHDGILELNNGNYSLRQRNGTRQAITVLPAALREHVGSRIYIVGAVDRPSSWGIIRAK